MSSSPALGWWSARVRQFVRHLVGRVSSAERAELARWLTPTQLALFAAMHRADQRHGLDVVASLRRAGHDQHALLIAGLLHDCGKARHVGLWQRVGWSLAERYGARARSIGRRLPGFAAAFDNLDDHPRRSAELAAAAGCDELTVELIRQQAAPGDSPLGRALRLADEAS